MEGGNVEREGYLEGEGTRKGMKCKWESGVSTTHNEIVRTILKQND